jgi:hypothetical protein
MPALRIVTDKPVECRLLTTDGASAPSNFGVDQIKYRTDLGDLYVSLAVGAIIADAIQKHAIEAGQVIRVLKATVPLSNGRKGIRWSVEPVLTTPVMNTDLSHGIRGASSGPGQSNQPVPVVVIEPERKPVAPAPAARPQWADILLAQTNLLADVYAAAVAHSSATHGNAVRPEDVRAIMTTAFINLSKGINHAA